MPRTQLEVLIDVVDVVKGLQVPVSIKREILGAAYEPWQRLKADLEPFGWMATDDDAKYVRKLRALLGIET